MKKMTTTLLALFLLTVGAVWALDSDVEAPQADLTPVEATPPAEASDVALAESAEGTGNILPKNFDQLLLDDQVQVGYCCEVQCEWEFDQCMQDCGNQSCGATCQANRQACIYSC